jgi:hypothetical protein
MAYPKAYYRALSTLATDAQWGYVCRLMNEAFANLYQNVPNIDVHHQPTYYSKSQASADIARLLAAKSRGWSD